MTPASAPNGTPSEAFASCHARLAEADALFDELHAGWSALGQADPWESYAVPDSEFLWRIDVACRWPQDLAQHMDDLALRFAQSIRAVMDEAVLAAASVECSSLGPVPDSKHQMPLTKTSAQFTEFREAGNLLGLRPDQIRLLEAFQPWTAGTPMRDEVGLLMTHLLEILSKEEGRRLSIWGDSARPEAYVGDVRIDEIRATGPGRLDPVHTAATFRVPLDHVGEQVAANPNIGFDLIFNAPPLPRNHEDNLASRAGALLGVASKLAELLKRSVSQPPLAAARLGDALPVEMDSPWVPVVFDDHHELHRVVADLDQSPLGLASYRDGDGNFTLIRINRQIDVDEAGGSDDESVSSPVEGRIVPQASLIDPNLPLGTATENAALAAAQEWGLADFVYVPEARKKGSGVRELGDGTIISGDKGLAVQVKARDATPTDPEAEVRWLIKRAKKASQQAAGTVRTFLNQPEVSLRNLRGREVVTHGTAKTWVGVVILDHPSPPPGVIPTSTTKLPTVFVLRSDWEFVWDQLRSASAVVDYFHRVAMSPNDSPALGEEALRYLDFAHADLIAEPTQSAWTHAAGLTTTSDPTLPIEPASTDDTIGHSLFRHVLDEIADSSWDGPEDVRLDILARLDRYPVTGRAKLGRALIEWLDACMIIPPGHLRLHHRSLFLDDGHLHLAFSVYSTFTDYHTGLHRSWLMLRRHQLLEKHTTVDGPSFDAEDVWTVGVLLTPRLDGLRMWDTTIAATNVLPDFDPGDLDLFTQQFGPLGTEGNLREALADQTG